jgi:carbon starvation protein CstA
MWRLTIGLLVLLLGYLLYSRLVERAVSPLHDPTPAILREDGVDYVPISKWRNQLIQLLNIAGTGPVFGALMGAKWGPIVFLWIILGTIFGGAVHDYMAGMMSIRNGGSSTSAVIRKYLGNWIRYPALVLILFLLVLFAATFARSAGDLLVELTGIPIIVWMIVIFNYFMASALLPINKLIGKIYPVFGVILILTAVILVAGLIAGGYSFPTMTLNNLHPTGMEYFPDMLITVACGAISGFHATQSPLVARCVTDEKDGRMIFYGAMIIESVIALVWATAGLAFYGDTAALTADLNSGGASGVVYNMSLALAGPVGGALAILGVVILPVTSGDTALRSARMMIQDDRGLDPANLRGSLIITVAITAIIGLLFTLDFTVLWNYTAWMNQTLATVVLWTASLFLLRTARNRLYSLMTALPALFMTMVVISFIMHSSQGLSLDYGISIIIGLLVTISAAVAFIRCMFTVSREE